MCLNDGNRGPHAHRVSAPKTILVFAPAPTSVSGWGYGRFRLILGDLERILSFTGGPLFRRFGRFLHRLTRYKSAQCGADPVLNLAGEADLCPLALVDISGWSDPFFFRLRNIVPM